MTKKYALYAVITALTVAISLIVFIPIPGSNGVFTLIDAGIITASLLFGPLGGLAVGALSGGLLDLISGYGQWFIFSAIIHGIQGYVAGHAKGAPRGKQVSILMLATLIMVTGYAFANIILYGSPAAAIAGLPTDTIQSAFGAIVAVPLSETLKRYMFTIDK